MSKKICPYNHARERQHYEQNDTTNACDERIGYSYEMQVDFVPMPCVGEDCGAWCDGKCCYSSVTLNNK